MSGDNLELVGIMGDKLNAIANTNLPNVEIYCSTGLSIHLEKRNHQKCLKYVDKIAEIIKTPDYVGRNPSETDSIELVKKYDDNILVAIKLDYKETYLYVASIYDISDSKVERRLNSGRLKKYN